MLGGVERKSNKAKVIIPSHKSYKDCNTLKKHDNLWPSLKIGNRHLKRSEWMSSLWQQPSRQTSFDLQKEEVILWTRLVQNGIGVYKCKWKLGKKGVTHRLSLC